KVEQIEIHDVKENTFYACMRLSGPRKREIELDARPSDAVALALRTGARILVARKVVERMQKIDLREKQPPALPMGGVSVKDAARLKELLENLTDDHFGKWKM